MRDQNNKVVCSRCGKKVGNITIKRIFKFKMFIIGFGIVFLMQLAAEWIVNLLLFGGGGRGL